MNSSDEIMQRFYDRATQLGHDINVIKKDGKQITKKRVMNLQEMRELVGPRDPSQRAKRQAELSARLADGATSFTDRIEFYLYGTGEISEEEHAEAQEGFPVDVTLASYEDVVTLPVGEKLIGPTWTPTVENYVTLNIPSDSWITVQNTFYTLNVQTLVMQFPRPPVA